MDLLSNDSQAPYRGVPAAVMLSITPPRGVCTACVFTMEVLNMDWLCAMIELLLAILVGVKIVFMYLCLKTKVLIFKNTH